MLLVFVKPNYWEWEHPETLFLPVCSGGVNLKIQDYMFVSIINKAERKKKNAFNLCAFSLVYCIVTNSKHYRFFKHPIATCTAEMSFRPDAPDSQTLISCSNLGFITFANMTAHIHVIRRHFILHSGCTFFIHRGKNFSQRCSSESLRIATRSEKSQIISASTRHFMRPQRYGADRHFDDIIQLRRDEGAGRCLDSNPLIGWQGMLHVNRLFAVPGTMANTQNRMYG